MRKFRIYSIIFLAFFLAAGCSQSPDAATKIVEIKTVRPAADVSDDFILKDPYVKEIKKETNAKNVYILTSWNADNFGKSKTKEIIGSMASFMQSSDIVVLQEISTSDFGARAVTDLLRELNLKGEKWDCSVSDSTHKSKEKERFAFLWKTTRIKAMPQKPVLYGSLKNDLVREPAKMIFQIGSKKLVVVSFHLAPTAKHPRKEVQALLQHQAEFSEEKIIFLGDFNLGHKDLDPIFEEKMGFHRNIIGKTSLKNKLDENGDYLSKEYDNIYTKGIPVLKSGILNFVGPRKYLSEARKISDHLPVFIVFEF
jgi:endonuclease/exonuclease/phosphatase family metal-dependent hydrolase